MATYSRETPIQDAAPFITRRQIGLIRLSAIRQLKIRYRGTIFGVFWSFANPILMTALYTALFGTAFAKYYGNSVPQYVFSAFIGVTVVTLFLQGTSEALVSVVSNGGLLNKIAVDCEIFPLASVAANVCQQAVTSLPCILLVCIVATRSPLHVVLTMIMACLIVVFITGTGLLLAAGYVFFRDLSYLWNVIGFVLWMTSPVFYPAAIVPERIRIWFEINPIALMISGLRMAALGGERLELKLFAISAAVALGSMALGHAVFRIAKPAFMDLL